MYSDQIQVTCVKREITEWGQGAPNPASWSHFSGTLLERSKSQRCHHHESEDLNSKCQFTVRNHTQAWQFASSACSVWKVGKSKGSLLRDLCYSPDAGCLCVSSYIFSRAREELNRMKQFKKWRERREPWLALAYAESIWIFSDISLAMQGNIRSVCLDHRSTGRYSIHI